MTGERVLAQDAYRVGLANHVVTREEMLPAARDGCGDVLQEQVRARMTKDAFNAALNGSSLEDAKPHGGPQPGAHRRERDNRRCEVAGVGAPQKGSLKDRSCYLRTSINSSTVTPARPMSALRVPLATSG
jgi:hypothetical protein